MTEEIAGRGGAVPFRDFMSLALYHPEHGYYSSPEPRHGRPGDYLTAPTASGWYAWVLARLLGALAGRLGQLTLADIGSGDGSLIASLVAVPGVETSVVGTILSVERSAGLRRLQRKRLAEVAGRLVVSEALPMAADDGVPTVVHASELYDAAPVSRVVQRGRRLMELWVAETDGGLGWEERPAPSELGGYLEGHGVELADGQLAELNSSARADHGRLLEWAGDPGVALVLDYGYEASRLYRARGRGGGSLSTFQRHRLGRDPLERPGELDITAHVNWDDLRGAASQAGWVEVGLWSLAELLVRAGIEEVVVGRGMGPEAELTAGVYAERQELKRLLDPDGMGADLKVLVQASGGAAEAARATLCSADRTGTMR